MAIGYLLFRTFAWLISRLPFRLLYIKADVLAFIIHRIAGYRRGVVMDNLKRAFPEKNEADLKAIASRYYRNLADVILETLKVETMEEKDFRERIHLEGKEVMDQLYDKGRNCMLAIGHQGNWEWLGPGMQTYLQQHCYAVIKPLKNKHFHDYLEGLRSKFFANRTIPFKMTLRHLLQKKEEVYQVIIAADQTPTIEEARYWTLFLNQETPFFEGLEKISARLGMAVCYLDMFRTARGRYTARFTLITEDGSKESEGYVTQKYIDLLESSILRHPDNWLWSHRRWKHRRQGLPLQPRLNKADNP